MVMRGNVRAGTIKQIQRGECKRECVQRVVIDVSRSRRNRKTSNDHALLNKTNAIPETSAGAILHRLTVFTFHCVNFLPRLTKSLVDEALILTYN